MDKRNIFLLGCGIILVSLVVILSSNTDEGFISENKCIMDTVEARRIYDQELAYYTNTVLPFANATNDATIRQSLATAHSNFQTAYNNFIATPLCSSSCINGSINTQYGNVIQCTCPSTSTLVGTTCTPNFSISQDYINQISGYSTQLSQIPLKQFATSTRPLTCGRSHTCGFDINGNPCGMNNGKCATGSQQFCVDNICKILSCNSNSDCTIHNPLSRCGANKTCQVNNI